MIREQIQNYSSQMTASDVGTVIQTSDGIARIYGLEKAMQGELLLFPGDVAGMAMNLEEDSIGAVLLETFRTSRRRSCQEYGAYRGGPGRRRYARAGSKRAGAAH